MPLDLSPDVKVRIRDLVARYPRPQAALLPVLHLVQHELGYLSVDAQAAVARELDVPPTLVHEVTTFYEMYHQHPEGQFHLELCTNISCHLAGADLLVAHVKQALGIDVGHQTQDGLFSLMEAECLASCGSGPMMKCGSDYYEYLTVPAIDALIARFRSEAPALQGKHYDHGKDGPHVGPVKGFEPQRSEAAPVPAPPPVAPPPAAPEGKAEPPPAPVPAPELTTKGPEPSQMPAPDDQPMLKVDVVATGDSGKNLPSFDPPPLKRRASGEASISEPPHVASETGAGATDDKGEK